MGVFLSRVENAGLDLKNAGKEVPDDEIAYHMIGHLPSVSTRNNHVLLATACVSLYNSQGHKIKAKAILDNGSQNSFVTEGLIEKLGYVPYNHSTIVSGIGLTENVHPRISLLIQTAAEDELEQQVSRFWKLEEVAKAESLSPYDEAAGSLFLQTTKVLKDGRFQVNLPLKSQSENLKLGDSFAIARRRFDNLEKRFIRDLLYYAEYKKFVNEYVSLGHGKVVPLSLTNELSQPKYLLPHHAVFKEDSVSTKVRVVFDGSCKSSSGISLNDILLTGYQVQPDLFDILWRTDDITELDHLYFQLNSLLTSHGFKLHKWCSNSRQFLNKFSEEVTTERDFNLENVSSKFNPSQCYDPLGFLSPLIVRGKTVKLIEFHGFADASLRAYAACVYIRTVYIDNTVSCFLISSKSRVAPLKTVTLPRLELCAMLLLAQLTDKLLNIFKTRFHVDSVVLWSEIALNWIKSHSSRNIFVANRVAQIQELTKNFTWCHVRSENNPADLPSRGVLKSDLLHMQLWWNGPEFLSDSAWKYSDMSEIEVPVMEVPEERKLVLVSSIMSYQNNYWDSWFNKYSSFSRLQRVIAYCLRFHHNVRSDDKWYGSLQVHELNAALKLVVKVLQHIHFHKEIQDSKNQKPLRDKVGGRLENAEIPYDQKHPMLLPPRNYVVSLMLKQKHESLGHAGAQNVLSNFRAQPTHQLMADLPRDRVLESRCFSRVGVDYGGPFVIKSSNLRKAPLVKAYIAVFVCMSTKAVHLEMVFKNGKLQESIKEFASQNEIEFKFIPPRSPHWGGVWEAAVKSTKHHLKRLIGEAHFTFEEFYTVLVQIESILNSRPLCPLSNDSNDVQILTPGHFLIGASLTAPSERDVTKIKENRLTRWQRISKVTQTFWNRWRVDYLNRLQNRPKWFHPVPELQIGSLVLLKDEETPPLKWPLARVLEVFPGTCFPNMPIYGNELNPQRSLVVTHVTQNFPTRSSKG
ncbi:uncharacterized protein LOC123321740 [Coccinella septempunctata]|uniref:uncharacterized protein LOC123321740 n=1 Tax=Coccinella septempunctata TaxID=41139 RepID=UPI001D079736|nr:uncharacterized protein LOC123321740 [Coccinella septempunctata]